MENYWQDNNQNGKKHGMRGVLAACFCCALASALISWGVCSVYSSNEQAQADTLLTTSAQQAVDEGADSTINVGKTVSPAVVFISNIQNVRSFMGYGYGFGYSQPTEAVASTGSGVIYSADGYIITNNHVVDGAEKISVTLYDGNSYIAEVVGCDERTDLAVIKIEPDEKLTVAKFGDSDELVVGETAIAIGNPGGEDFANSLTRGVISGLNRSVTTSDGTVLNVVQTDAAINPGNSGGALCNARGEVIGINTIKISMDGYEGMGFAIPSNEVLTICKELMANGKIARPALGVGILADVTPQIAYYNNLSVESGVLVAPSAGGAAEKAGLKSYDIIVAIDDGEIKTYSELQSVIFGHEIGDTVKVTVVRGGETMDFQVTLGELAD